MQALEEAGCIQKLGKTSMKTQMALGHLYGCCFVQDLNDKVMCLKKKRAKRPWGRWLWVVNVTRFDQVNPQLLLSRPLLEQVEKMYGKDPQVRAADEEEQGTGVIPWRADPAL